MKIILESTTDGAIGGWIFNIDASIWELQQLREALDILEKLPHD